MIILFLIYIIASLCIAIVGLNRKFGFWGYFFASLLLSPLIGIILLLGSDKKKKTEWDDIVVDSKALKRRKAQLSEELDQVDSQIDYMNSRNKRS
tara:strand:+ start:1864 stop:2148 length:285 start_codon:yes stop_codon:yes gene_type:complete